MLINHFTRRNLKGIIELEPKSSDFNEKYENHVQKDKAQIYVANPKFIFAIMDQDLKEWKKSGHLNSLLDMIVEMNWMERSVYQWKINIPDSELTKAFVRETYHISPMLIGSDLDERPEFKKYYREQYLLMLNSIVPFSEYKNDFKNAELLIPFNINAKCMTFFRTID